MHDFEPVDFGQYTRHDSGLFVPAPQESPQDYLPGHLRQYAPDQGEPYHNFYSPIARHELYEMTQTAAEYIRENDIKAVAFVDRSARPFATALRTYWDLTHQDEVGTHPATYFVNPYGVGNEPFGLRLPAQRPAKKFAKQLPGLNAHKDDSVLLMDTCVHTGKTIQPLVKAFKAAGFDQLHFGVASDAGNRSDITPDVILLPRQPYVQCYPFGHEFATETAGHSLVSELTKQVTDPDLALRVQRHTNELRAEVRRVICEGYVAEKTGVSFDRYRMPPEIASGPLGRLVSMLLEF